MIGAKHKGKSLNGFVADLKDFKKRLLPKQFTAFQRWIALNLYRRIMQKTPVDKGMLRGSWTVTVNYQDRAPANGNTSATDGQGLTPAEIAMFQQGLAAMADMQIGQVIWLNNAMPYVLRIEFDEHSKEKAPQGMVRISIGELKVWLQSAKRKFKTEIGDKIT